MNDDVILLRRYAEEGSESAFSEIVSRHIDLVYSAALRQVAGDTHLAQDVAQCVFADLARKARTVSRHGILTGWLYQATRYAASKAVRNERRRATRENEAVAMQELSSDTNWERLRPVLDEAVSRLGAKDRDAVLLRYFERKELRAVGDALGTTEEAARKRVSRALERLRRYLTGRGVTLSAATLATAMTASAVQAAPTTLAGAISTTVIAGVATAAAGSSFTLLNLMSMTKLKAGLLSAAIVVGAGTPIVLQQQSVARLRAENRELRDQALQSEQLRLENQQFAGLRVDTEELNRLRSQVAELHRLRAEVARLRSEKEEVARLQAATTRMNGQLKPLAAQAGQAQRELMNSCINNLRIIEGAKEQWALEHKKGTGAVVNADGLADYCKDSVIPTCPAGGTYALNQIGETSSCSIHGALPVEVTPEALAAIQQQFNARTNVLPFIEFRDQPLSDAIATLARSANLNPVFDPEVVQRLNAVLSIRMEHVTYKAALEAILSTNNLRLVQTPGALWQRPQDWGSWPGDIVGISRK